MLTATALFQSPSTSSSGRRRGLIATIFAMCLTVVSTNAEVKPPYTDYCRRLEQEIQGRKHGFMAGNVTYYVGGFHASWDPVEHETIGLTHPFHHDLRSRGVGLLESQLSGTEHTGRGNDYTGWEFYKDTRVLYGSVTARGKTWVNPVPKSMTWRPDRISCHYDLDGILLNETKFIGRNDAAASIITSSEPVTLSFSGHSFFHRHSVASTAVIRYDQKENAIVISEGGTVRCRPDPNGNERVGPCVYTGMTTALCVSRPVGDTIAFSTNDRGAMRYEFRVACDRTGTVVSWAMHDDERVAVQNAGDIIRNHQEWLGEKTQVLNSFLNNQVPWFRCPDRKFEDIYYYLWSLYMMYYIDVGRGWEVENHTQTAVNNFLGMHRYDAVFQIKVGAWTADARRYAYGNVLTWKHLTQNNRFRENASGARFLSDNKGTTWHSGAYGAETSEHVIGAWQIYQHTGDRKFVRACYEDHFAKLFRRKLPGFAMNSFEVADILAQMAVLSGHPDHVPRWRELVRRDSEHIRRMFEQRWEANGVSGYFAAPDNRMIMTNGFWAMRSRHFPREYAQQMVQQWALNRKDGFLGAFFPLAMSRKSMKEFRSPVDHSFGYTPDTAYFTLDGMFRQRLLPTASELTLNHIEHYNYHPQWKIPVAPEAYRRDLKLFGDQYSNFNAGKILLILEGLAGLEYSVPQSIMKIRPALPERWDWMEVRLPIKGTWTRVRYRGKDVEVTGCPFPVTIEKFAPVQ